jgi:hypothetical protein
MQLGKKIASFLAVATSVLTGTALWASGAFAATSPVHSSTTAYLRFAPEYEGGNMAITSSQALAQAKSFTVISAYSGIYTPYVAEMKKVNPALKLVTYQNAEYAQHNQGSTYPASWYARDKYGNQIRSLAYGNFLMLPTNPAWVALVAKTCTSLISESHYDGCMLDCLGTAVLTSGYSTGYPINPATKQPFTPNAWEAATSNIAKAVQTANKNAVILPNGIANGTNFFAGSGSTEPLVSATGLGMAEIWLRNYYASPTDYPTLSVWESNVKLLTVAESKGWSILPVVKLWVSASTAQQNAWHTYAIASFLMGADGRSALSFSTAATVPAITAITPIDQAATAIGLPTAAYTLHGNLAERTFTHGLAYVNTGSSAMLVTLPGSYKNLEGQTVTSETLAGHGGDVFTN